MAAQHPLETACDQHFIDTVAPGEPPFGPATNVTANCLHERPAPLGRAHEICTTHCSGLAPSRSMKFSNAMVLTSVQDAEQPLPSGMPHACTRSTRNGAVVGVGEIDAMLERSMRFKPAVYLAKTHGTLLFGRTSAFPVAGPSTMLGPGRRDRSASSGVAPPAAVKAGRNCTSSAPVENALPCGAARRAGHANAVDALRRRAEPDLQNCGATDAVRLRWPTSNPPTTTRRHT
jgi:hypothetical protein